MTHYPWTIADARKRPKRIEKKLTARGFWRHFPPKGRPFPSLYQQLCQEKKFPDLKGYVPTRQGARKAAPWELLYAIGGRERILAVTDVGPVQVSTAFLCVDHDSVFGTKINRKPVLWETMLFSESMEIGQAAFESRGVDAEDAAYLEQEQWRYRSRKDALVHHRSLVGMLRNYFD